MFYKFNPNVQQLFVRLSVFDWPKHIRPSVRPKTPFWTWTFGLQLKIVGNLEIFVFFGVLDSETLRPKCFWENSLCVHPNTPFPSTFYGRTLICVLKSFISIQKKKFNLWKLFWPNSDIKLELFDLDLTHKKLLIWFNLIRWINDKRLSASRSILLRQ